MTRAEERAARKAARESGGKGAEEPSTDREHLEVSKKYLLFVWDADGAKQLGPFDSFDEAAANVPDDAHSAGIAPIRLEMVK